MNSENKKKADNIRDFLIESCQETGGHIGANLSVIELTIALHSSFNIDKDSIIFDTGHQGYTHKILTGRKNLFPSLNSLNGMSRFLTRTESKYDLIEASHAGTALSISCGLAFANNLNKNKDWVVGIIGDGSLVEGMSFEGLNYASKLKNLCIVLNDNEIAIDLNVGGINNIMTSKNCKISSKDFFGSLGFDHYYVEDGHDLDLLSKTFELVKQHENPSVVHVKTIKGKGLKIAKNHPYKLHFSMPFQKDDLKTTSPVPVGESFSSVASNKLYDLMKENRKIISLTPGTPYASSLNKIKENISDQYIDVGMAEQHIFGMAVGLSIKGKIPIVNIQSTFMQRSFDQIVHDVSYMNEKILTIAVRNGFSGFDSATHHGIFDISYLTIIPNIEISCPAFIDRVEVFLDHYLNNKGLDKPTIMLLPYEPVLKEFYKRELYKELSFGMQREIQIDCKDKSTLLISMSNSNSFCEELMKKCEQNSFQLTHLILEDISLKSKEEIKSFISNFSSLITLEQNVLRGGLGSIFSEIITDYDLNIKLLRKGIDDCFISPGTSLSCLKESGIEIDNIINHIKDL
jgi:1-deoxy-D-xylulose-5-phosphate synthase